MKRKAVDKTTMLQTVDESAAFNCNDDTTAAVDTPGNLDGTGTADDSTGERIKSKGQYFNYAHILISSRILCHSLYCCCSSH